MEYQVSWGIGGDTLLMPSQKDVIRGHIQRYLTANSREHDAISNETIKALETLYGNLNESEADDFTTILSDIVNDILQDEDIAINFYKKDNEAWEEYLGGAKTAKNDSLRELLTDYAEATTLYEVHVGSSDYDRLRGQSGYKFGRDMQKLPKFDLDAFKREYNLKPEIYGGRIVLEVSITKKGATKTRGTFEEAYEKAMRARPKLRKSLKKKFEGLSIEALVKGINKKLGAAGELTQAKLDLMEERFKKGRVKSNLKQQLIKMAVDLNSTLTGSFKELIDDNIGITYKLTALDPNIMFYDVSGSASYTKELGILAQAQLDEKSKQIKERGVVSGGWTSKSGSEIKFSPAMFERDEDDIEEEEDFKGEIFLEAETVNGNYKDITLFTLEDMVPEEFLKDGNAKKKIFTLRIKTKALFDQLVADGRYVQFLDFGVGEIDKVIVNMVEVKFSLPPQKTKGTTTTEGNFFRTQQMLNERLSNIKVATSLKSAPIAIWDTQTYSRESINPSRKMQEHLSLFKERVEDLIDYYDVEVSGEVNDMED